MSWSIRWCWFFRFYIHPTLTAGTRPLILEGDCKIGGNYLENYGENLRGYQCVKENVSGFQYGGENLSGVQYMTGRTEPLWIPIWRGELSGFQYSGENLSGFQYGGENLSGFQYGGRIYLDFNMSRRMSYDLHVLQGVKNVLWPLVLLDISCQNLP